MTLRKYKSAYLVFLICVFGCSQNLLTELGSKSSDEALLVDAQKAVNAQEYQSAIDIITQKLSSSGQQKTLAKEILASGYAGKCGLNFADFVTSLSNAGAVSAFKMVSKPFVGRVVDPQSCLTALTTLGTIGNFTNRTNNQNAFASVVGMSLMGSATRAYTDLVPANGDGAEDATKISCTLTDAQIDFVILGFGYMAENFSALTASQIGSGSQSGLSDIINKCASIGSGNCTITDPAAISPLLRLTMRDLLETVEYGVGTTSVAGDDSLIPGACSP